MGNKFLKAEGIIKNATGIPSNQLFHDHQKLPKNIYLTTPNTNILSSQSCEDMYCFIIYIIITKPVFSANL